MAAGDNSGRPPCLNFSGLGHLGNSQPSNSAFSRPNSNSGAAGPVGGARGTARRSNPQSGPGGAESNGVAAGNQPNTQNSVQQALAHGVAAPGIGAGVTATSASNMITTAASNASPAAIPATHSSLPAAAAAAVLVYREPVYNWQATKSTVKERFAFLFNNEVLSDVHFLVGKGMGVQRIPAHR